ncbi:MAG: DNA cytosine methyltransferase [Imperialibacter sp.]|uniref:DNA cytosine methyltransferase n=1 Tax=Imperialibacter sp. TaxID=2038411 RepID=UPI003A8BD2F2
MSTPNTYIDLFAGCGGLSLGLHLSGWKGLFAIEKNKDAFSTLEHNLLNKKKHFEWPGWLPQTNHDINAILKSHSEELSRLKDQVDLVVGGPPCQGFSSAGKRYEQDERNKLIDSYIKFIRIVQPKMIFFENVRGFTQQFDRNKVKGRIYSQYVTMALKRKVIDCVGYKVHGQLINFAEYGVPQKRTRFILVGIRRDIAASVNPELFFNRLKNDREKFLVSKGLSITTSLNEAISDLLYSHGQTESPDSRGFKAGVYGVAGSGYQKYLRAQNSCEIPDSHRFPNHKELTIKRFQHILLNAPKNKTLSEDLKKAYGIKKHTVIPLAGNMPASTITTLPDDYLHYSEPRIFTVREYARIQSFKDWYEFKGKYTTGGKMRTQEVPRYSQIGNAIPPLFGEQVGRVLSQMID